ncbi:MAG: glycosyltransferase family 9 protein [Alphaproteobacteria bacterium]|nr:glycosyltransferase family 9 protein [Alphaproteobacteria bacterium]
MTKPQTSPIQIIGILSGREIIGDALIKIPFLRALRTTWPDAQIHWVTTKGSTAYSGPLRETIKPLINEVHEVPDWLHSSSSAAPDFDLLIDTRGRWKMALAARMSLPHKLFIAPAARYLFSDRRPSLFSKRPSRLIQRLLQTVELASGFAPPVTGRLPAPADFMAKARHILPEGQIYVGFAPGAGNPIKKWPLDHFIKVAQLQARMNRFPVFILGPDEMGIYDELFRAVPEAIFPLQAHEAWGDDKICLEKTLALGHCLDIAVTNDSGTSHMLAAVDCPLVSLFGPTSASKLAPSVSLGAVLRAQDYGSNDMIAIPPEAVHEAVNKVLLLQKRM